MNNIFYDVDCYITNDGKNLFAKQANGIKFAKVGAVLFSDYNKKIYNDFISDEKKLCNITYDKLLNSTTIIYPNLTYTTTDGLIYIPQSQEKYDNAKYSISYMLKMNTSYNNSKECGEYKLDIYIDTLSIESTVTQNFDGFAILGMPYKPTIEDTVITGRYIENQKLSLLALVYFSKEKIQVIPGQDKHINFNPIIEFYLRNIIQLDGLTYINSDEEVPKRQIRFLNGFHLTNDGLNDRG